MSPNLTDQDRKRMGFDLNDILISCMFDLVKCNASDFEWYYDIFYGYKTKIIEYHTIDIIIILLADILKVMLQV